MYSALIAPRRYVQGRGSLAALGQEVKPLGQVALVIADEVVWTLVGEIISKSLSSAGLRMVQAGFGGECSDPEIKRLVGIGQEQRADVIVGVGGGKTLDTAKAVGHELGVNWAVVPTLASTDAPTSALSVIYTPEGVFDRYLILPKNPDLVLVDTQVIAQAPARFLAAGIGDALATWVEARATLESRKPTLTGGVPSLAASNIAKLCWETLFTYGVQAVEAVERHAVTPAVEYTVEANTLMSGLGFESGGLAAAHAIHNGLTVLEETHSLMHGEKVNFGTLTQLFLEGRSTAEVNEFIELSLQVGLPTTLADLNLAETPREDLLRVAQGACAEGETIHNMPFAVTPEMVLDAMLAADAHARAFKASRS